MGPPLQHVCGIAIGYCEARAVIIRRDATTNAIADAIARHRDAALASAPSMEATRAVRDATENSIRATTSDDTRRRGARDAAPARRARSRRECRRRRVGDA